MNILSTPLSIKRNWLFYDCQGIYWISKFYNLSAIIDRKVGVVGGKGTTFFNLHCIWNDLVHDNVYDYDYRYDVFGDVYLTMVIW